MSESDMRWLVEFAAIAEKTDRFAGADQHVGLLAAGLMGEAGSVLTELKKEQRERDAYPAYRRKMLEEVGDFLWYFVRLVCLTTPRLLKQLEPPPTSERPLGNAQALPL